MSTALLRCSVGDLPVLSGSLVLLLRANWTATLTAHGATAPAAGSRASLVFTREDGTQDVFVGTVRRSGVSAGSAALSVTIVGGKGLLLDELDPRDHAPGVTEIPAGLIAKGICDDAGEVLAAGVETALDAVTVHRWTRIAMPARDALDLLVDTIGWGWRVLANGTVWAGQETWPASDATKFLAAIPDEAGAVYACDGAPLRPGVTLATPEGGRRIVEVVYSVSPGAARATVRATVPGGPPPVRGSRELYAPSYAATVRELVEVADGIGLVLVPDDPRLGDTDRPLRGVLFRMGIPGCLVTFPAGVRVRVRFEGGDPRGVYACDVDQAPEPTYPLALVGDRGDGGTLTGLANLSTGVVTFTYTPPFLAPPSIGASVSISTVLTGPGHKYAKGVSGS